MKRWIHGLLFITSNCCSIFAGAQSDLPGRYYELLEAGVKRIQKIFNAQPYPSLASLEKGQSIGHFPHAIIVPAVLYTQQNSVNGSFGNKELLSLALRIGDMLASENSKGNFSKRYDSDWDTYMWMEAYRILEKDLSAQQKKNWSQAIIQNLQLLEPLLKKYEDRPWYNAPFIVTSPNHYSIYASSLLVGGHVFGKPEWVTLANRILHRFCTEEQSRDGFWGEHSREGPTTGYDYVTMTQVSLYWEYTKDPEALKALRRSADFHLNYTYPDGTPVETINDRNRYWGVPAWGHFGFSNFPDGRRYASLLTSYLPLYGDTVSYGGDLQTLARVAQNILYYHSGEDSTAPQEKLRYHHQMSIPAGIRKSEDWTVSYSGIIAPPVSINNFFLDRQSHFSVFNKRTGLIISGANSKRQSELATFTESMPGDSIHMPVSSRLVMTDSSDKLSLAYNVFFATLCFYPPDGKRLSFDVKTFYKWGVAQTEMNLQLMLKTGSELVTGTGTKYTLGAESLMLDSAALGGEIHHNGWTMKIPQGCVLRWPVFPFNPYRDANETELSQAIGRLTIPLKAEDQVLPFSIEVENSLVEYFTPPAQFVNELGKYRDPLLFYNGKQVQTKSDWRKRRKEILQRWHALMGEWPPIIENPAYSIKDSVHKENFTQYTIEFNWRKDEKTTAYLLVPDARGKKPAVMTVFYEPETAISQKRPTIAYAYELAKRGYVTLSLGTNYFAHNKPFSQYYPDDKHAMVQPLSMLGYLAANAYQLLAHHNEVDSSKVGIMGFSYGSKWAMFASCLYEKFACAVWVDGGIVFDESRPNVNYWEPWYLGYYPPPWEKHVRKGLYQELRKKDMDLTELHVLMAPRPFLVSGGSEEPLDRWIALNSTVRVNDFLGYKNRVGLTTRPDHLPDENANKTIWQFFDYFLR